MYTLDILPYDTYAVVLDKVSDSTPIPYLMLSYVSKQLLKSTAAYAKARQIPRKMECHQAASQGYLDILKWIRLNGYKWDYRTCYHAAQIGRLDIIKWAVSEGCPINYHTIIGAIRCGNLPILKWYHANEFDRGYLNYVGESNIAALHGQLHILKWLYNYNQYFTLDAYLNAAQNGHLNVLKWINNKNIRPVIDPDGKLCEKASQWNRRHVFNWARENGFVCDGETEANARLKWPEFMEEPSRNSADVPDCEAI